MAEIKPKLPSVKHHSRVISTKGIADIHTNIRTNLKNVFMMFIYYWLVIIC